MVWTWHWTRSSCEHRSTYSPACIWWSKIFWKGDNYHYKLSGQLSIFNYLNNYYLSGLWVILKIINYWLSGVERDYTGRMIIKKQIKKLDSESYYGKEWTINLRDLFLNSNKQHAKDNRFTGHWPQRQPSLSLTCLTWCLALSPWSIAENNSYYIISFSWSTVENINQMTW